MKGTSLFRAFTLCAVSAVMAVAQTPQTTTPPAAETKTHGGTTKSQPSNKKSPDAAALGRRITAISLLTNLADEALGFRDPALRVRVEARVADALWGGDEARARQLFLRAWDELQSFEKEGSRNSDGESSGNTDKRQSPIAVANLRGEVLRLASLRDHELAEQLLDKLDNKAGAGGTDAASAAAPASDLTPSEAGRMELAQQLLGGGYTDSAQELAAPLLNRVTEQTIRFLSVLRQRDPDTADSQFASLLSRAASDPSADAITVSLLSSYIFSPLFFVSVTRDGFTNSSQYGRMLPPPELSPALRAAFFRTAAQILLRPLPPPEQDHTAAGRPGMYFTIMRLLPLFERFAPDYVPALQTQLAAVSKPVYTDIFNPHTNQHLAEGLTPGNKVADGGAGQPDLSRAKNASERDAIYVSAAQNAAVKGDEAARDYADKIDDTDLRQQARSYTDFLLLTAAIDARQPEKVVRLARSDYLTAFQRAWALTEAARLFKSYEPARASELLTEAAAEARRIDDGSPNRVRALLAVASQLHDFDLQSTWALANEIVAAANKAKDFTGDDSRMVMRLKLKETLAEKNFSAPGLSLNGLFGKLAKDDLYVSISIAKNLTAEAPRAAALISIARAVLGEPLPPASRR